VDRLSTPLLLLMFIVLALKVILMIALLLVNI